MLLKKSYYNVLVDKLENNDLLIYNSFTGALGVLKNEWLKEKYISDSIINEDKVEDKEILDNIAIMVNNGFLVESNLDEIKRVETVGRITRYGSNVSRFITIAPTLNCNMRCPYCYEEKPNIRMTDEVRQDVINYIKKTLIINRSRNLNITWYGGEPLLEKETIKIISKEIIDYCNKNQINYSASIVTNGTLLDYETAVMLKDVKVNRAQITLDGVGVINDKTRVLKNGESSFNIITSNIGRTKDIINIDIRANLTKNNLDNIDEFIEYIDSKEDWKGEVSLYVALVTATEEVNSCYAKYCFTYHEFGEIYHNLATKLYNKGLKTKIFYPTSRTADCGAVTENNIVIGPDGRLYKCWHRMGKIQHNVGDVKHGIKYNQEYVEWLMLDTPDECRGCIKLPICRSGCPVERLRNGNKSNCDYRVNDYINDLKCFYNSINHR